MGIPAWTIRTPLGEYHAKVRFFGPPPELKEAEEARSVWFFASCDIRNLEADAVEAALELTGELSGGAELDQRVRMDDARAEQLIEELDNALTAGLMYFERVEWSSLPSPDAEEAEPPSEPVQPDIKSWIGVTLLDGDGKPVSDRQYRLVKPDGAAVEGRLDSNGSVLVQGLDTGECQVSFEDRTSR